MHTSLKKEIKAKFAPYSIDKDMVQIYELVMNGEIYLGNSVEDASKKACKAIVKYFLYNQRLNGFFSVLPVFSGYK